MVALLNILLQDAYPYQSAVYTVCNKTLLGVHCPLVWAIPDLTIYKGSMYWWQVHGLHKCIAYSGNMHTRWFTDYKISGIVIWLHDIRKEQSVFFNIIVSV